MLDTGLDNNFELNNFVAAGEVNEDPYSLNAVRSTSDSVGYFQGSLEADLFEIDSSYEVLVISGNGNVDFGSQLYDTIALANVSVDEIANLSLADAAGGGVAIDWNSDIYNIDVLNDNTGDLTPLEATQEMIDEADSQGKNLVINMSFGIDTFGTLHEEHTELEQLVADNPNTLFTIATNNQGHLGIAGLTSPDILALDYDNVMAVGAAWGKSDRDGNPTVPGTRIEYDDWGSGFGDGLTVIGPSEVVTTNATAEGEFNYDYFNGTSAATPNVSGVASLIWSANSDLTAAEVKEIISETAYDLGAEDYDIFYGHGMVNADAAVRRAMAVARHQNSVAV